VLALVAGVRQVFADSNRFAARGAHSGLTVVSAAAALAGRPSILGTIPIGSFPREMPLEPNGDTLLVGNFGSDQLEAVAVGHLPLKRRTIEGVASHQGSLHSFNDREAELPPADVAVAALSRRGQELPGWSVR
jgi:hypothetical protein